MVTGPRKSSGYMSALLSDSDWEADVLPLDDTRNSTKRLRSAQADGLFVDATSQRLS